MAKSTGNIERVPEIVDRGIPARALRLALISAHYRTTLSFTEDSLAAATSAVERLDALIAALGAYQSDSDDDPTLGHLLEGAREAFVAAMDDDLNISPALAAVFDLVRELNRRLAARSLSTADAATSLQALRDLDQVLGLLPPADDALSPELQALLDARVAARAAKQWAESDRLRDVLAEQGIAVEDTRDGQRWRRQVATRA